MAATTLKMYRARTMADALAEVKRDLGKDAVILHTRAYRVGGIWGLGSKPMVEITASSGEPREARVRTRPTAAVRAYAAAGSVSAVPRAPRAVEPEPVFETRSPVAVAPEPEPRPASDVRAPIEAELRSLKRMVGEVLQTTRRTAGAPASTGSDVLFAQYLTLLENEVAGEIADEVVAKVRRELSDEEQGNPVAVRKAMLKQLAALVPAAGEVPRAGRVEDGRPLTVALVGPTGVGKTTTIAKLAAAYKLRQGKRVALVTSDTYRIAAVEQLRTYAEIIGVPLRVVMSPEDMAAACGALRDYDLILIDTAGRSARDGARVEELKAFVEAANPHETHLVLSGTSSEGVLMETARRFAAVGPNRVIFTKLDEAVNYGVLLNVASRVSLRLSFVTTGQEVPDHIEAGRGERLAKLVLPMGSVA